MQVFDITARRSLPLHRQPMAVQRQSGHHWRQRCEVPTLNAGPVIHAVPVPNCQTRLPVV